MSQNIADTIKILRLSLRISERKWQQESSLFQYSKRFKLFNKGPYITEILGVMPQNMGNINTPILALYSLFVCLSEKKQEPAAVGSNVC